MVSPVSAIGKISVLVLDRTPGYYFLHCIGMQDIIFRQSTFTRM